MRIITAPQSFKDTIQYTRYRQVIGDMHRGLKSGLDDLRGENPYDQINDIWGYYFFGKVRHEGAISHYNAAQLTSVTFNQYLADVSENREQINSLSPRRRNVQKDAQLGSNYFLDLCNSYTEQMGDRKITNPLFDYTIDRCVNLTPTERIILNKCRLDYILPDITRFCLYASDPVERETRRQAVDIDRHLNFNANQTFTAKDISKPLGLSLNRHHSHGADVDNMLKTFQTHMRPQRMKPR